MMLPVLVLADQSPKLLGLILHHINGILQRAHLHLDTKRHIQLNPWWKGRKLSMCMCHISFPHGYQGDFRNSENCQASENHVKFKMRQNEWLSSSPLLSFPPPPSGRSQGEVGRGSGSFSQSRDSVEGGDREQSVCSLLLATAGSMAKVWWRNDCVE